eukprot:UN12166
MTLRREVTSQQFSCKLLYNSNRLMMFRSRSLAKKHLSRDVRLFEGFCTKRNTLTGNEFEVKSKNK